MFHVRCMFAGNGRDDAAAVSVADGFDGPLLGQQFADRQRGRHADCVEGKGLEPEAGGCDLFYTLSRGSYQRPAGTFVDDGKCGAISIPRKGRFDVERARAQEIPQKFWSRLQKGETIEEEGRTLTPDMVLGGDRKGIKVAYCTDTRPLPVIAEYAKDADLFICEGMYGEDGKEAKAREYKHMTFQEAAHLAKEAQPKEMWLTHYSPSLIRPDDYMDKVREIFPRAKAARDGWTAELGFDEE